MLRRPAIAPPAHTQAQAITAAARRIDPTDRTDVASVKRRHQRWQDEAWQYFDEIGEVKYGANFHGKALRKVRVFPAVRLDPSEEPVPLDDLLDPDVRAKLAAGGTVLPDEAMLAEVAAAADDALRRLDESSAGGIGALQARYAVNRFVAGECYLVLTDRADVDGEWCSILSIDELVVRDDRMYLRLDPDWKQDDQVQLDPAATLLSRMWTPHDRYQYRADSPMRGVLDVCETLFLLTAEVRGSAGSRLNNGLVMFPETMFPAPRAESDGFDGIAEGDGRVDSLDAQQNPHLQALMAHIEAGIQDPRSASVVSPFLMTADPDDIAAVRHLVFDRPHDVQAAKDRDDLLRRLANGVDLPVEVLLGLADVNHWTAWQIDRDTFTAHIEPVVLDWCQALAVGYWLPAVRAIADPGTLDLVLWYDEQNLVQKPDQSELAGSLHDRILISDGFARQMVGVPEEAAPDDAEVAERVARAQGGAAMPAEDGVPSTSQPPTGENTPEGPPLAASSPVQPLQAAAAPDPRIRRVGRVLGAIDAALLDRVVVAADAAVGRALDRAGAKLRTKARTASSAHADLLAAVPNPMVASTLGPGIIAALDVSTEFLLDGALTDLQAKFDTWTRRAQAQALGELEALDVDDDVLAEARAQQDDSAGAAWLWLSAALGVLLAARVFDPRPAATPGEFDPSIAVPAGVVRQALVIAGGDNAPAKPTSLASIGSLTGTPTGGVATGTTIDRVLVTVGFRRAGYEWVYGDPSSRQTPFEPHADLDGIEFQSWTDDVLVNGNDWPPSTYLYPGDHLYCQCTFVPLYAGPSTEEPPAE